MDRLPVDYQPLPVSGIVMAGGKSRRFGRDKALVPLRGQPLLLRVGEQLATVCQEVIVVGPPERKLVLPNACVVQDIFPNAGPLAGLHAALKRAQHLWSMVVACDMPFLNPALLRYLLSLREGYDVVLPRHGGYTQQLHAAYSASCLPHIEAQLTRGDYKIDRFFPAVRVRYVDEPELRLHDELLRSFFNANTPEALAEVEAQMAEDG